MQKNKELTLVLKELKIDFFMIRKCNNNHYSLEEICIVCNEKTFNPEPPKFSLTDKHGKERRKMLYGETE